MVANSRAASRSRGFGEGPDSNKRLQQKQPFGINSTFSGQAKEQASGRDLYDLKTRLREMRLGLDEGAASRGVSLGSSYFDDY
ncbi:MAG: hypothetical protein O2962_07140 [Cyanobacteria bacterium]|nr:hypothetical protein [Cyanobacteriota bacterium]